VHCHIGSQIFGTEAFEIAADRLLGFTAKYRDTYGAELPELDLGGGYGIAYLADEVTVDLQFPSSQVAILLVQQCLPCMK
jgi:diaminopimelate decarboxylase